MRTAVQACTAVVSWDGMTADERNWSDDRPDAGPSGPPLPDLDDVASIDIASIEAEEAAAARRLSSIEAGRRKAGLLGAATAGAMLGLRDIYEGPPKDDDVVEVAEAPGEPGDIDRDGITGSVDGIDFHSRPGSADT